VTIKIIAGKAVNIPDGPNPDQPPPPPRPSFNADELAAGLTVVKKLPPESPTEPPDWAVNQLAPHTQTRSEAYQLLKDCRAVNPSQSWGWVANKTLGELWGKRHTKQPPKPPAPKVLNVPKALPKRPPIEYPTRLMYRLDDLTGERAISERLVRKIALNHPERSGTWCVEKALWDLQRDRY